MLISREGIAKRLDLAEERPPTEEDYFDQLTTRFGVKYEKKALKSPSPSLLALEKLEHVTLSPSPHLLILLAQHIHLDTCKEEEEQDEEPLTPWTSTSHHKIASQLLDRLASTHHGMMDGTDEEDVDKVTLLLIKEDRRLLTRSLQLLQGELQEVSFGA